MFAMEGSIPEFYKGKSVFVTGATGFMGKVLIEKLFRSCPCVENIYIIIRHKPGKTILQRLNEMQALPVFSRLKEEYPGIMKQKLVAVEGDIMKPHLGLSDLDYATLSKKIDIIFHVAASIRFNDTLSHAFQINTLGTKEVIELAHCMKNLKVFVHVSTTYCNCDRKEVEEIVYPPHADWKSTSLVVQNTDPAILNILTPKYIGKMPNTYTFTKSLAEQLVWEERSKLPVIIFRPSIVISSWKEPLPGWIDNMNGPIGILIGCGKGVIRTTLTDTEVVPDFMPVDLAIRAMIVASWRKGHLQGNDPSDHIYNASSVQKSLSVHEMVKVSIRSVEKYPFSETLWDYSTHTTKNKTWFTINVWFRHVIPAILIDIIRVISGKTPMLLKIQQKIYSAMIALGFFTTRAWIFHNSNFLAMNEELLPPDRKDFDFNFQDLDPLEYFESATIGARKFLLNENDDKLPSAKLRAKCIRWMDRIAKSIGWAALLWILISNETPRKLFGAFFKLSK